MLNGQRRNYFTLRISMITTAPTSTQTMAIGKMVA